jgi:hypothetical protein
MPFPNPASGATESEFVLYQPQTVSAWLSSANLADSLVPSGTTIPKITPKRIADLFVDATLAAGTNAVMISLKDSSNSPLPAGFYRIYLKAGNDTITRDVVLCYGAASDPCSIIHWK